MLHAIDRFPASDRDRAPTILSAQPTIHPTCHIRASHVGSWTELGPQTTLVQSTFDDYSYAAGDVSIISTDVGKFCSIASHVRINPGNHPMDRVTQHHMTYRRTQYGFGETDDADFFAWRAAARCTIGHDVWLGHAATIMAGVQIGIGAVVGAGAVVTRDVAPYDIVVGVPARRVRARFAPDIVRGLLASSWWQWDHATLAARFDELHDPAAFVARYSS